MLCSWIGAWVSLVLWMVLGLASGQSAEGVCLRLHFSSHRNATGHRLLQAQVQSAGGTKQRLDVDMEQRETELNTGKLLIIDALATVTGDPEEKQLKVRYPGYTSLPGANAPKGLYKYHRVALTWPEAKAVCEAEHAHLLVAETKAEAAAAASLFSSAPEPVHAVRKDMFFVGFSDEQTPHLFISVTGKNLTCMEFQTWQSPGEPSKHPTEIYMAMTKQTQLHDIPKPWRLPYICEAPSDNQHGH